MFYERLLVSRAFFQTNRRIGPNDVNDESVSLYLSDIFVSVKQN